MGLGTLPCRRSRASGPTQPGTGIGRAVTTWHTVQKGETIITAQCEAQGPSSPSRLSALQLPYLGTSPARLPQVLSPCPRPCSLVFVWFSDVCARHCEHELTYCLCYFGQVTYLLCLGFLTSKVVVIIIVSLYIAAVWIKYS